MAAADASHFPLAPLTAPASDYHDTPLDMSARRIRRAQTVDVRDVAEAHAVALTAASAPGKRFVLSAQSVFYDELAKALGDKFSPQGCVSLLLPRLLSVSAVVLACAPAAKMRGAETPPPFRLLAEVLPRFSFAAPRGGFPSLQIQRGDVCAPVLAPVDRLLLREAGTLIRSICLLSRFSSSPLLTVRPPQLGSSRVDLRDSSHNDRRRKLLTTNAATPRRHPRCERTRR